MSRTRRIALIILAAAFLLGILSVALYCSRPDQPDTTPTRPATPPVLHPTAMPQASLWNRIEKTTYPRGR